MKKVFVAYADEKMKYSLHRIGKQARRLDIFDEIILYTPNDLPQYAKDSTLMQYSYGGGYWLWKPVIIYETLQKYEDGTVVCYIDAGCTLNQGIEWYLFFELMEQYTGLCFKYPDIMQCWKKFGTDSTKIKHWTKKKALLELDNLVGSSAYRECNKVMGGVLFFRGRRNSFVADWLNISLNMPSIIIDPKGNEMDNQYPFFAQHKHDQPVITALAFKYREEVLILPELFENPTKRTAILASRIRAKNLLDFLKLRLKLFIRECVGEAMVEKLKKVTK